MSDEIIYGRNAVNEALRAGKHLIRRLYLADGVGEKRTGNRPTRAAPTGSARQPRPGKPVRAYTDPKAPANAPFHAEDGEGDAAAEEGRTTLASILQQAAARALPIERLARYDLDGLTNRANHQGVAAESQAFIYADYHDLLALARQEVIGDALGRDTAPFFLVLDFLQDPQNLGTLIRTAEAVGVTAVVIPERRAAGVTPAVRNASSGAVEHITVAQVTNLAQTLTALKELGVWVGGLDRGKDAIAYDRANLRGKLALVVGSEGSGIGRLVRQKCDFIIQLPMLGQIESLNAATAGSIALYEALRQRKKDEPKKGREE